VALIPRSAIRSSTCQSSVATPAKHAGCATGVSGGAELRRARASTRTVRISAERSPTALRAAEKTLASARSSSPVIRSARLKPAKRSRLDTVTAVVVIQGSVLQERRLSVA
jgi:hypothetical protein